eukprot:TRINITY_DN2899_c0_g1_i2.p2 TRINITY_DN2899_c0_g1~~TRINITY_DN2899_c0_g1_i2.p2  ORF type:complete len:101 (+),score=19.62 TRINITY_DN2899_c0_g1_i2:1010-1312(+)
MFQPIEDGTYTCNRSDRDIINYKTSCQNIITALLHYNGFNGDDNGDDDCDGDGDGDDNGDDNGDDGDGDDDTMAMLVLMTTTMKVVTTTMVMKKDRITRV